MGAGIICGQGISHFVAVMDKCKVFFNDDPNPKWLWVNNCLHVARILFLSILTFLFRLFQFHFACKPWWVVWCLLHMRRQIAQPKVIVHLHYAHRNWTFLISMACLDKIYVYVLPYNVLIRLAIPHQFNFVYFQRHTHTTPHISKMLYSSLWHPCWKALCFKQGYQICLYSIWKMISKEEFSVFHLMVGCLRNVGQ